MRTATPVTQEVKDKVAEIVRETLAERFDPSEFVFDPIIVEERVDHYDDEYIHILILFDGSIEQLDASKTVGLIRRILPKMEADGIYVTNLPSKGFAEKAEWEYVQKHGWGDELSANPYDRMPANQASEPELQAAGDYAMRTATPVTQEVKDKVAEIVRETLAERFDPAEFVFDPIIVEERVDHYDDEYIYIFILFDGSMDRLDPGWTAGLVGRILPKMEAAGIYVTNLPGKIIAQKAEWEYVQKHGWGDEYP